MGKMGMHMIWEISNCGTVVYNYFGQHNTHIHMRMLTFVPLLLLPLPFPLHAAFGALLTVGALLALGALLTVGALLAFGALLPPFPFPLPASFLASGNISISKIASSPVPPPPPPPPRVVG